MHEGVTGFDKLKRFAVVAVNSLADTENDWGTHEAPPNVVSMLIRATGASNCRSPSRRSARTRLITISRKPGGMTSTPSNYRGSLLPKVLW